MIAPNMATMLAFVAVDADVSQTVLQEIFKRAVDASFNMTSVDTDTSTNDLALVFATGKTPFDATREEDVAALEDVLTRACISLARQMAADGEGAERLIEVEVRGAATLEDARKAAKNIVSSPLVKTAVHGADPNWGRVVMAVGKDPAVRVDPETVDLFFGDVQLLARSALLPFDQTAARETMRGPEVKITVDLNLGSAGARAWGCDLTKGYIDINTEYN